MQKKSPPFPEPKPSLRRVSATVQLLGLEKKLKKKKKKKKKARNRTGTELPNHPNLKSRNNNFQNLRNSYKYFIYSDDGATNFIVKSARKPGTKEKKHKLKSPKKKAKKSTAFQFSFRPVFFSKSNFCENENEKKCGKKRKASKSPPTGAKAA